jgi:hypothetical protein
MPFINEESRAKYPDTDGWEKNLAKAATEGVVGDRCFVCYREMIHAWNKSPRWTTAHLIYRNMLDEQPYLGIDDRTASQLAWQVFFTLYVMPYEWTKREANGEVE